MESIANPSRVYPALSAKHYNEIVQGSGVDPRYVKGAFRTITRSEALALGFSSLQARDGLLIEVPAPDGEMGYQLKPDKPRPQLDDASNPKVKNGEIKRVKYETRARHDIRLGIPLPALERVTRGTGDILVVEGAKKGFCALSRGYDPVILTGVWNWGRKRTGAGGVKYGRPELLEDWEHIPLEGRRVSIVPDADYKTNAQVARAFKTLADRLQERGAKVYIVDLPGPEKGLDDYVTAGGDLDKVIREARPYDPTIFTAYIAKQVPRLREAVERIHQAADREPWAGRSGKTDHSLFRALVELALERGRMEGGEPEVVVGVRELMERAGVGSRSTLTKATARLVDRGSVEKITGDREKGQANRYRLKFSKGVPGEIGEAGTSPAPSIGGTETANFTPHLRWAAPALLDREPRDTPGRQTRPVQVGTDTSPMNALGKVAEFYLNRLVAWGGDSTLRDLSTASGINDTSKTRRALEDLEVAGVLEMDTKGKHGARVRLAPDWRVRLDERRGEGGELARGRWQALKHRHDRLGYLDRGSANKAPSEADMQGPERTAAVIEARRDEWRRRDEEERQDARQETPEEIQAKAERLTEKTLRNLGTVRYGLLRDMWTKDQDGREIDLRRALRDLGYPLRPHAEHPGELWVYPAEGRSAPVPTPKAPSAPEPEPEPVQALRSSAPTPEVSDDWRSHPLDCPCDECAAPLPRYARIGD